MVNRQERLDSHNYREKSKCPNQPRNFLSLKCRHSSTLLWLGSSNRLPLLHLVWLITRGARG